jgi:hypothetical protein
VRRFDFDDLLSFGFALQILPHKIEGSLKENIVSLFYVPKTCAAFKL